VIVAVALFPSTAAIIVVTPAATPTTIPEDETVTFATSELVQEKLRCNASPEALLAVAESWTVAAGTKVAVSVERATVATVGGGGGPTTSPPPHEPISQPRVIDPRDR